MHVDMDSGCTAPATTAAQTAPPDATGNNGGNQMVPSPPTNYIFKIGTANKKELATLQSTRGPERLHDVENGVSSLELRVSRCVVRIRMSEGSTEDCIDVSSNNAVFLWRLPVMRLALVCWEVCTGAKKTGSSDFRCFPKSSQNTAHKPVFNKPRISRRLKSLSFMV